MGTLRNVLCIRVKYFAVSEHGGESSLRTHYREEYDMNAAGGNPRGFGLCRLDSNQISLCTESSHRDSTEIATQRWLKAEKPSC